MNAGSRVAATAERSRASIAGATYYSDEYAVLDRHGAVHPYPRRLSIREDGGALPAERHVHELGGVAADQLAEVAAVVLTRYRTGATWQPESMSIGAGALALLVNTLPAWARPREALTVVSRAPRQATVLRDERAEAEDVAASLIAQLGPPRVASS